MATAILCINVALFACGHQVDTWPLFEAIELQTSVVSSVSFNWCVEESKLMSFLANCPGHYD